MGKRRVAFIAGAGLVGAAALVSLTGCAEAVHYDGPHTGCVVTGKDRTSGNNANESNMRVYTQNCGTFEVGDLPFHGQYNSADVYGSILPGHTYNFDAYGWRNGYSSDFPTILTATEVK